VTPPDAETTPATNKPATNKYIPEQVCKRYVAILAAMKDGAPASVYPVDEAMDLALRYPPAPSRGWKPIRKSDNHRSPGARILITRTEVVLAGKRYPLVASKPLGAVKKLAQAIKSHLRGRGSKVLWVEVRPGGSIPLAQQLGKATLGAELRLLVRKPPSSTIKYHLAVYPRTPAKIAAMIRAKGPYSGVDEFIAPMLAAARGCIAVPKALELLRQGGGIDVLGPALATALDACQCEMADADGFVSLVTYVTVPYPLAAWVRL
jgi:hypothetical protein